MAACVTAVTAYLEEETVSAEDHIVAGGQVVHTLVPAQLEGVQFITNI